MIIEEMIGKTFTKVSEPDKENLIFESDDLTVRFYHSQDCCESVQITQVDGDYSDLIGSAIIMAEFECNENRPCQGDSGTWTFYKFGTVKGYVTVRWHGQSNGYYSEKVAVEINGNYSLKYS